MRIVHQIALLLATASAAGCISDPDLTRQTSSLVISATLPGGADVSGMEFVVTEAACSPGAPAGANSWRATVELADMVLPGDLSTFENRPYDSDSEHLFADRYFVVPAGCYDVLVRPVDAQGGPALTCYSAHQDGVIVVDGDTTEITLISQCQAPPRGGLDVVATVNRPPEIVDLTFDPSKFVSKCEPVDVCVTASDPDGDPIEFVWSQLDGKLLTSPPASSTTLNPDGSITQCGSIGPGEVGTYEFQVEVFDLAYDSSGQQVRIEELLSTQGDPHESRDSIEFPLHSGVECLPPGPLSCTRTQGYWKTHHAYASNPAQQTTWPLPEDTMLCGQTWLQILQTNPAGGSAWYILAHQYIAAQLNIAGGASSTSAVDSAIVDAEAFLLACTIAPADRQAALDAAGLLDEYNNGDIGPGHCH